jgi:hypothetical protein
MKSMTPVLAVAALLLGAGATTAHHSFSPVYDGSRSVTVAGIVTEFQFVNPHAQLTLDVTDESGKTTTWHVEFDGRLNLTNGGWTDDTITVGERISVTGNPTHTGSPRIFFARLERADGSVLLRPGVSKLQSIEEERRQRIEQRRQQSGDSR